jgi:hypothetical protein
MVVTDKPIDNVKVVGGDYFRLIYARNSNKKLSDYLPLFNFDDYWCYKTTNNFREVDYEAFLEFKYAGYSFFRKDLYKREHINMWAKLCSELNGVWYLVKPTPPFSPSKVIIKKK